MKVQFTSEARDDLFEAAEYYESKEEGLGSRFRNEVSKILGTVASSPACGASGRPAAGKSIVRCFPTTLHTSSERIALW